MNQEQIKADREALSSLDDYASMSVGVNAIGPRGVLEAFIGAVEHSLSAQDEVLTDTPQENPHAATFPAEIWLNVGDGDSHEVGPYKDLAELSWCWECIDKYDVRYVRADLAAAAPSPAVAVESEPVLWVESENNIRDKGARYAINSLCHTVVYHLEKPETDNPVWPLYAATPSPSLAVRDIPREPTSEMMEAANRQREVGGDTKDCWRAMWDAAMREQP